MCHGLGRPLPFRPIAAGQPDSLSGRGIYMQTQTVVLPRANVGCSSLIQVGPLWV